MELEFDKEINAILRKAGRQGSVAVGRTASPHVDADTIAAFAENALPSRARPPLIEHFAACDNCREMLSQTVLLNAEADATAASSVVPAIVAETAIPWYQRLFKTPGLALAMGGLILVFTGVLAYLALQNRNSSNSATTVSQLNEPEAQRGGPYDSGETGAANANVSVSNATSANSVAMAPANLAATGNPAVPDGQPALVANAAPAAPGTLARGDAAESRERPADDGRSTADSVASGVTTTLPAAGAAQPAPPALEPPAKTEEDEKKPDLDKQNEFGKDQELSRRKETNDRGGGYRDAPPAAAKSGPTRSGPFQMQSNQMGNKAGEMSVTRSVGGKTFNNRSGAWYDSAYHGQATINVGRGSDEFKKLDGGLRNIANNLGGVVVVVWKGKAYRIQ
jgi:hypothetical protein